MRPGSFVVADVDALVELLLEHDDLRSVTRDRRKLVVPGVVVQLAGLSPGTMTSLGVQLTLQLVARDTDDKVTWSDLATLFNAVVDVFLENNVAFGDATGSLVTLPAAKDKPMPALQLPVEILTTQEVTP